MPPHQSSRRAPDGAVLKTDKPPRGFRRTDQTDLAMHQMVYRLLRSATREIGIPALLPPVPKPRGAAASGSLSLGLLQSISRIPPNLACPLRGEFSPPVYPRGSAQLPALCLALYRFCPRRRHVRAVHRSSV